MIGPPCAAQNRTQPAMKSPLKPFIKPLMWLLALVALALTFAAYWQPGVVLDVASRLWACI